MVHQQLPLLVPDVNENQQHNTVCQKKYIIMIAQIINRILIAVIGIGLGLVLFIPNAMMCDSGTKVALLAAYIGMAACVSFVVGGIVGAIYQKWYCLLPGLILQISAFVVPAMLYKWHEQEMSERSAAADRAPNYEATSEYFTEMRRAARNIKLAKSNTDTPPN